MKNGENSFKSSINNATTSMRRDATCCFILNEMHEEEKLPPVNEQESHLNRNTPILFSTNRGLHLRTASISTTHSPHSLMSTNTTNVTERNFYYNVVFCDLERWSTNRANTISLEDTFTIPKTALVATSRTSSSLKLLPRIHTSVRSNGYSRFNVD